MPRPVARQKAEPHARDPTLRHRARGRAKGAIDVDRLGVVQFQPLGKTRSADHPDMPAHSLISAGGTRMPATTKSFKCAR